MCHGSVQQIPLVTGSGRITREAFEHPRGMLQFVLYSLPSLKREAELCKLCAILQHGPNGAFLVLILFWERQPYILGILGYLNLL